MSHSPPISVDLLSSLQRFFVFFFADVAKEISHSISTSGQFSLSIKRILWLMTLLVCIPSLIGWNHLGFLLDDLFYPQWRSCLIKQPLFVIGNARSGTTYFHRLLAEHETMFTTMKTWEIFFAASVTWRYLFIALYRVDEVYFCSVLHCIVRRIERFAFGEAMSPLSVHPIGLDLPEEDEWIMLHIFSSQLVLLFFPLGLEVDSKASPIPALVPFDCSPTPLSIESRMAIMQYYRQCVQRHMFARGFHNSEVRFLSKNPPFTLRLETLHRVFPDIKVCCMIRDPVESVPSMVSYIAQVWRAFSSPRKKYPNPDTLIGFCELHYLYPLEYFNNTNLLLPNQKSFLSYHHLISRSQAPIHELLRLFYGSDISMPQFFMEGETQGKNSHKSTHIHSVEECCGMSNQKMRSLMKKVYVAHSGLLSDSNANQ